MGNLQALYDVLPPSAQNLAFSAAGWNIQRTRYGKGFRRILAEFESHAGWSAEQLAEWRDERLRALVMHAYATVPYYRDVMDDGGIDPVSIRTSEDLKRLPLLTKDMVKAQPERFISSKAKDMRLLHVHTSGTTGSGFQFLSTVECQQAQFACFWRYYRSHGLTFDTWEAQFSSRNVVPLRVTRPPFWRVDRPGRRYYMSAFHESPANLSAYYELICDKDLAWISGYPSLMVLLAQWMNERGLRFDHVRWVTCGAENLLDFQADAMERAFGARPVQTYGQTENVAIFSQQPDGRVLVDEDFSAVEFLPLENGSGGGRLSARSSGRACSTTPRRSSATAPRTSLCSETARARAGRSPRSTGGARTTCAFRMARAWASSTTCSRTPRTSRRRRFTKGRTIRLSFASLGSRTNA